MNFDCEMCKNLLYDQNEVPLMRALRLQPCLHDYDVLVQVGGGGGEHELAGRRSDKSAVARRNLSCNFPYGQNM